MPAEDARVSRLVRLEIQELYVARTAVHSAVEGAGISGRNTEAEALLLQSVSEELVRPGFYTIVTRVS